jgi:hypothetical protein
MQHMSTLLFERLAERDEPRRRIVVPTHLVTRS